MMAASAGQEIAAAVAVAPGAVARDIGEHRRRVRLPKLHLVQQPLARRRDILERLAALPVPSETQLRELFDLTAAEARLAQALARGDSLEEVAGRLNIKITTAKTQLGSIFAKTETCRQAQLVALLCRLAQCA